MFVVIMRIQFKLFGVIEGGAVATAVDNAGNAAKPLKKSQIAGGHGGVGDLDAERYGQRSLGADATRLREQIGQSQSEGFPPGYQQLLEQYYNRLAERRGEDPAAPAPS